MAENKTNTSNRGRKPKTNTQPKAETKDFEEKDLVEKLDKANKEKNEMAEMLKQMQEQMKLMQQQINSQNNNASQVVITQNDNITRTVDVISMIGNTYNLCTQPYGKGKVYTFNKFGEKKSIRFSDMQDILTLRLEQFEKGYAILTNKKDYDDLGIGYIYNEVMDKEKMEKLINLSSDESIDTILSMDKDMQEKVISVIARKIADGKSYDYNKIKMLEDEGFEINNLVEILKASEDK